MLLNKKQMQTAYTQEKSPIEKEKSTTKFLKKQEKLIVHLMLKNMQANMV